MKLRARFGRRLAAVGVAMLSIVASPMAATAESVAAGDVVALRVWAYGTAPDAPTRRDLFMRDPVYVRDKLETVEDGALHVHLLDDTVLRLGSATQLVIDEFVYRESQGSLEFLASVTKGVCRFVTGRASDKRFRIATPTASIVARGTVFSVWVDAAGETVVWVQEGEVEVVSSVDGDTAAVGAREIVRAPLAGGIELNAPRPKPDPGIGDTSGLNRKIRKGSP
jgi:hypothetical protein